jgi:cell shape-determining protein MreC
MKKRIALFFVFGVIAIIMAILSGFFINSGFGSIIGIISTIMSVLLSVTAMFYTYFSGTKTLELLEKIEAQNKKLADKINLDLLKDAYDEEGIKAIRERWSMDTANLEKTST